MRASKSDEANKSHEGKHCEGFSMYIVTRRLR